MFVSHNQLLTGWSKDDTNVSSSCCGHICSSGRCGQLPTVCTRYDI